MDSIFQMSKDARAAFLQQILQAFGCTYICLWTYLPLPSNCLLCMDGIYHEENKQTSLSFGISPGHRLFNEYRKSVILTDSRAPGLAFKNNLPYIEFKEFDLQSVASTKVQLQFYQEARIKTAIYMGCKTGEIELGISIVNQANIEMEMRKLFPEDFSRQTISVDQLPQPNEYIPHSSSSSSLRSLSTDHSPESTPSNFLYSIINNTGTSYNNIPEPPLAHSAQTLMSQVQNIQHFPTTMIEREDATMTQAILAVISSSSATSSSGSHQPLQKTSAFKRYRSVLGNTSQTTSRFHKQNMLKRAIAFCRSTASQMRASQEQMNIENANRPTSNQLHHMISERKRREKLNESFQALRTLLPPGSKKDKASLLSNTTEYINTLKAEVEELTRKNQTLEAQLQQLGSIDDQDLVMASRFLADQSHDVWITNLSESTSEARNFSVIVRDDHCSMLDLAIGVLEFLKQLRYVNLLSLQAEVPTVETTSFIRLDFRLKIEERGEWDEKAFQEAVKSVVADLAR